MMLYEYSVSISIAGRLTAKRFRLLWCLPSCPHGGGPMLKGRTKPLCGGQSLGQRTLRSENPVPFPTAVPSAGPPRPGL